MSLLTLLVNRGRWRFRRRQSAVTTQVPNEEMVLKVSRPDDPGIGPDWCLIRDKRSTVVIICPLTEKTFAVLFGDGRLKRYVRGRWNADTADFDSFALLEDQPW